MLVLNNKKNPNYQQKIEQDPNQLQKDEGMHNCPTEDETAILT